MRLRVPFSWMLATVLVSGVAGCTSIVAGSVVKAVDAATVRGANPSALDPGKYPAKPRAPYGNANSAGGGAVIEAHRMAANVVLPDEVDPALTGPSWFNTGTLAVPEVVSVDIPSPGPQIAAAHHLLFGFSTCRVSGGSGGQEMLINVVLRFPDPAAASSAAAELAAEVPPPVPGHPFAIPDYPTALAAAYDAQDFHAVASFVPHGPYLLYQYAQSAQGVDAAAHLVDATLGRQIPRIDAFVPTDPAHFPDLPNDSSGFLNRVVPAEAGNQAMANLGSYQPQAALHFEADPKAQELYTAGGVDAVAILRTTVYRARDPVGAQQVAEMAAADTVAEAGTEPQSGVPGVPFAKCFDTRRARRDEAQARFQCFGSADRYAFKAGSGDLIDVQQQMAAQYLMLTG
jgi:hypothetical protein